MVEGKFWVGGWDVFIFLFSGGCEMQRERLEKALAVKGYSLKRINGQTYLYMWKYENGRARWWCVGNINKVGIPEGRAGVLLEEIRRIDEVLREVARLLEVAKLEIWAVKQSGGVSYGKMEK
jgi:hypothetical protein